MGAQDCGCGSGSTGEWPGGIRNPKRAHVGRSEMPARIDLHWNIYAGKDARAMISMTGVGGSVRDARYAVDTGDHLLTYELDRSRSVRSWTVDEHESGWVEGGFGLLRRRGSIEKVSAHAAEAGIPPILKKLATTYPFPALLSVISLFGLAFDRTLIDVVDDAVRDLVRKEKIVRSINLGSGSTGCSEGGYCSPEFSSCTTCSEDTGIFGGAYDDWPPSGGGGGGGGGDDSITQWCNEQFLLALRECNYRKRRCDLSRPHTATSQETAAGSPVDSAFSDPKFDSFVIAADYDVCDAEFEACLADLQWRHQFCLGGGGWPLG